MKKRPKHMSFGGIIIASAENRARSQMAEQFFRALTGERIPVQSGGTRPARTLHPLTVALMDRLGLPGISAKSPTSLRVVGRSLLAPPKAAGRVTAKHTASHHSSSPFPLSLVSSSSYNGARLDLFISIVNDDDLPSSHRVDAASSSSSSAASASASSAPPSNQELAGSDAGRRGNEQAKVNDGGDDDDDELLFPTMPSHWTIVSDANETTARRTLWSPRDPKIAFENSTRKFQDDLYAGEPLFTQMRDVPFHASFRRRARLSEQWALEDVTCLSSPLEKEETRTKRFERMQQELFRRCVMALEAFEHKGLGEVPWDDRERARLEKELGV